MPSPKRKRDVHDPDVSSTSNSPSRGRSGTPDLTSIPPRLFSGIGSPRGKIIRQFEGLQIKGEDVSKIDWEKEIPYPTRELDSEDKSKRMRQVAKKPKISKSKGLEVIVDTAQPTSQVESPAEVPIPNISKESQILDQYSAVSEKAESSSRLEGEEEAVGEEEEVPTSKKSRSRQKSSSVRAGGTKQENLLTWQEHEITGHRKDDPDDDGEGLNGIGFMPTPALAYARVEKRRQQIQEYKNREAREARRIRGERRRGERAKESVDDDLQDEARRVRFAEVGNG